MPFIATCVDAIGTVFWDRPTQKHSKDYSAYVTEKITLNVPAWSPAARDLDELVGTHSASTDLSPVKSDKNIYPNKTS